MENKKIPYKKLVWFMLDQQFDNKDIYAKLACSQPAVSRAKAEWGKMCEAQKKKEIAEIRKLLGDRAEEYENPNKKKPDKPPEKETVQAGFRTPYSAARNGKTVISRY